MALKQANTLAPSNVSASGFALADARYIGGHRVVASLAALYALHDWQLLHPDETDTSLALGQQWYVKGDGPYRLTNWEKRKTSDGWTKEQAGLGNVTDGVHIPLNQKGAANGVATLDANSKVMESQLWEATEEKSGLMTTNMVKALTEIDLRMEDGKMAYIAVFDQYDAESNPQNSGTTDCTGDDGFIVYFAKQKRFLLYDPAENRHYSQWAGQEETGFNPNSPVANKLYILNGTEQQKPRVYVASETTHELRPLSNQDDIQVMSNDEIDALFA